MELAAGPRQGSEIESREEYEMTQCPVEGVRMRCAVDVL